MKRIGIKIVVFLFFISFITAFFILLISNNTVNNIIQYHTVNTGLESAKYNAERIETWAREKMASVKRTAVHFQRIESFDEEILRRMLADAAEADLSFYSVFAGFEDGKMIDGRGWIPEGEYDATQRPWYQLARVQNDLVFTPVYIDQNKNTWVTSIAIPIMLQGKEGVLAANIPIDTVLNQVNEIRYGKTGYGILLDEQGFIITHPQQEYVRKPINEIWMKEEMEILDGVLEGGTGSKTILIEEIEHLMVHVPIPSCGWELMLIAPLSEFQDPLKEMMKYLIFTLGICLVVMIFLGVFLGNSMAKPIEKMIKGISKIAKGDLTEDIKVKTGDELGELSIELNRMRTNLIDMIKDIRENSNLLYENAEKLTKSIEEISSGMIDFISLLSHDIRTPLTLVKGYAKGLQSGVVNDPQKVNDYLNGIYSRAEQIEFIISDILDCAYEVKKSLVLKREYIKLNECATTLFQNAKIQIESANRVFIGQLHVKEAYIYIDEIKMNRVWNNLISNAIQYSGLNSQISISIVQKENHVELSIKDEGIGIKEEDLDKIFEMFYRSKDSDVKGYGIGLFVSKNIVEAHGGSIKVKSEYGKGSQFIVHIPLCYKNDTE